MKFYKKQSDFSKQIAVVEILRVLAKKFNGRVVRVSNEVSFSVLPEFNL